MSLNRVIFKTGTYTVTRRHGGARVNGRWVPGAASTFPVDADLQPLTGREIRDLPAGQDATDVQIMFTVVELRTRSPESLTNDDPDIVTIAGEGWRVTEVQKYGSISQRYRVRIERLPVP